ncbi:hypothetical protein llap_5081 [Limosa lapponica baueri]|uniref:Uncharacterized protein n=1 Tax=Limosa lapponica baueri TaxID=1758121 RepID=A0A2I0UF23_LIMLA|nr:hypothetical protein llap_5081 [Limosa lapponica baueri]
MMMMMMDLTFNIEPGHKAIKQNSMTIRLKKSFKDGQSGSNHDTLFLVTLQDTDPKQAQGSPRLAQQKIVFQVVLLSLQPV